MLFGVVFALAATVCFAVGNLLEKRAVRTLDRFSVGRLPMAIRSLATSPSWIAGALVSVAGLGCQMLALSRLSISVVQSVGVIGIVLLVLLSHVHLQEALDARERVGLGVAVAGFVFVAFSLTHSSDSPGTSTPELATVICAIATFAVVAVAFSFKGFFGSSHGVAYGVGAGLFYGLSGLGAKGISAIVTGRGLEHGFRMLLSTAFPYVFVLGWVFGLAVFQFGIQRSRVAIVGPLSTMVGSVFVVAAGTPIFGERLPSEPGLFILRLTGFALLVTGGLLAMRGSESPIPRAAMGEAVSMEALTGRVESKDR
jgi:drug/metabolite transporter (DMT)-like permease